MTGVGCYWIALKVLCLGVWDGPSSSRKILRVDFFLVGWSCAVKGCLFMSFPRNPLGSHVLCFKAVRRSTFSDGCLFFWAFTGENPGLGVSNVDHSEGLAEPMMADSCGSPQRVLAQ